MSTETTTTDELSDEDIETLLAVIAENLDDDEHYVTYETVQSARKHLKAD